MALVVSDSQLGTSEAEWADCARLRRVPEWHVPAANRVAVLAPHPDDESLAVGGLLAHLMARNASILVIAVTDGEASHPNSTTTSPIRLAQRREREQRLAVRRLGSAATVVRLHVADGKVAESVRLMTRSGLVEELQQQLADVDFALAPYGRDGHPDHEAVTRAAERACRMKSVPLVEYPVWAWHWARPNSDDLPWWRARRVSLSPAVHARKLRALAAFRSQTEPLSALPGDEPILPPAVLQRFQREYEVVFV